MEVPEEIMEVQEEAVLVSISGSWVLSKDSAGSIFFRASQSLSSFF